MASYNKVVLMGNLVRDPELRYIPSGTAVCDVAIGVNTVVSKDRTEVAFVDLTFWGKQAELVNQYCQKGSPVLVDGRIQQDTWEAEDGSKRSKLKVVVERVQLLGGKSNGSGTSKEEKPAEVGEEVGSVPF